MLCFITDVKGQIEYVNSTFEQVTGYAKEEARARIPVYSPLERLPIQRTRSYENYSAGKTWRGHIQKQEEERTLLLGQWFNQFPLEMKRTNHPLSAVQEDITEKMQTEERAKYLASMMS